ncbi:glucan biosynthesis protein D [Methylopila jiangsuensis]|uniref:Glucans biosynthesis protein G n=1 Tax=Methylopila jiangsuensis TaxID=586230 RepID=A0A9W6JG31_9HYPH|nr:glucan biosynthesis protein G [Methylopila jiangsuensis]MDR6285472.1 glucans biosynthesis protein [Methylopila jiangsuensis]GLK75230.1 glucan biosynthesis protein D [Methylopila jiangsuensis]
MLTRRDAVVLLGAGAGALASASVSAQTPPPAPSDAPRVFDHGVVIERARRLAAEPFVEPKAELPQALKDMGFDAYRDVRFKRDRAYFAKGGSGFSMELFHLGFLYQQPVVVNLVREGVPAPIPYDSGLFDFGGNKAPGRLPIDLGFAGFRLHYPLNKPTVSDELAVFLGASYFRFLGAGQHYGISARGVAVGTGEQQPEEFPFFREFWVEEPGAAATGIVVHALLDGPSLTGAYRMVITPGEETTVDVGSTLFPRVSIPKLGVAALTSMFQYGENDRRQYRGFRPEVHDSDGLLVHGADDQWLWRPLINPRKLEKTLFPQGHARGFGLLQRDRLFEHYQDLEVRYDLRPSYWIAPQGDWGPGRVELVEIPTDHETFDNVVAYWVPDAAAEPGATLRFSYQIRSLKLAERLSPEGRALHTFVTDPRASGDPSAAPENVRRFIVDFAGGDLAYWLDDPRKVVTETSASTGKINAAFVVPNPEINGFRLFLDHEIEQPGEEAVVRAVLKAGAKTLTETWLFPWRRAG